MGVNFALWTVCYALVLTWFASAGEGELAPGFSPSWLDVLYCRESKNNRQRRTAGLFICVYMSCFALVHLQK